MKVDIIQQNAKKNEIKRYPFKRKKMNKQKECASFWVKRKSSL